MPAGLVAARRDPEGQSDRYRVGLVLAAGEPRAERAGLGTQERRRPGAILDGRGVAALLDFGALCCGPAYPLLLLCEDMLPAGQVEGARVAWRPPVDAEACGLNLLLPALEAGLPRRGQARGVVLDARDVHGRCLLGARCEPAPLVVERSAVRRVGVSSVEGTPLWPRAQQLEERVLARCVCARRCLAACVLRCPLVVPAADLCLYVLLLSLPMTVPPCPRTPIGTPYK